MSSRFETGSLPSVQRRRDGNPLAYRLSTATSPRVSRAKAYARGGTGFTSVAEVHSPRLTRTSFASSAQSEWRGLDDSSGEEEEELEEYYDLVGGEGDGIPLGTSALARKLRNLSRTQMSALRQFRLIDKGKTTTNDAFSGLSAGMERLVLKVAYYRTREELALPHVEERFMRTTQSGEKIVDVQKLGCWTNYMCCNVIAPPFSAPTAATSSSAAATVGDSGSRTGILSPSASMESFQQRAERLSERASERDEHIRNVREVERLQLTLKRQDQLEKLEKKALRKEVATRQRKLLTWLTAAAAFEVMIEVRKEHLRAWQEVKRRVRQRIPRATREHSPTSCKAWPRSLPGSRTQELLVEDVTRRELVASSEGIEGNSVRLQTLFLTMSGISSRLCREVLEERKHRAMCAWNIAFAAIKFFLLHTRAKKLKRYVDVIKVFISDTWRYFQMRRSMKNIIYSLRIIQFNLRVAFERRRLAKEHISMAIWAEETKILGGLVGMSAESVAKEIDDHRRYMKEERKRKLLQRLSLPRTPRHAPISCVIQGAQLVSMATSRSFDVRPPSAPKTRVWHEERGSPHGVGGRSSFQPDPMMPTIDRYRLTDDKREQVYRVIIRDCVDKFWTLYMEYKVKRHAVYEEQRKRNMLRDVLGKEIHAAMPSLQPPPYPYALHAVDSRLLHKEVLAMLRTGPAAQLL